MVNKAKQEKLLKKKKDKEWSIFIKRLKEEVREKCSNFYPYMIEDIIDKLAGEKLA